MRDRADVLALLRCLACGGALDLSPEETAPDGHVMTGRLSCAGCAATYPVRRGVPRLLPAGQADVVAETIDGFGYQWHQANPVLKDARFSSPDVFLDFIHPVTRPWFAGKTVLDAGCGAGRFSRLSAEFGATLVLAVDLASSVDVAFDNTRHLDQVVVVQADILTLPLARAFDYAFSIGVLHHTADPRGAFLGMASKVRPGGSISAWVYGRENNEWIVRYVDPVRRVTSRLPRPLLWCAAHVAAIPLTLAVKLVYAPLSRSRGAAGWRRRLFYFDYMIFLSQFGYREHAWIVFDHAVPVLAEYIPRDDFAEWFHAAGFADVTVTARANNSWRGFGQGRAAAGAPVGAA